jgi:hypothetical protein
LGVHISICVKTEVNQGKLFRDVRSQDLPDVNFFFLLIIWIGVQFRTLPPGGTATSVADASGLLYHPRISNRSYSGRQVPLASTTRGSPLAARGGTMDEKWRPDDACDMYLGFFNMPQICDMGPIILLPFTSEGRLAEDFYRPL